MTISVYCLFEKETIAQMGGNAGGCISAAMANDTWQPVSQEYKLGYVESEDLIECPHCSGPLGFHIDWRDIR